MHLNLQFGVCGYAKLGMNLKVAVVFVDFQLGSCIWYLMKV